MKIINFFYAHWKKLLGFFCIFLFILLFFLLISNKISTFDQFIYQIVTYYKNDTLTNFFLFLSYLCSTFFLVFVIVLFFLFFKEKKVSLAIALNVLLCYGLNIIFKDLIRRPRPTRINLVLESGYSFPSGHAMLSLAFYGFFIYLIVHSHWKKTYKITSCFLLSLLILLIGISRIYLGVHYASDILAGFSLSTIYLLIYTSFYKGKNT